MRAFIQYVTDDLLKEEADTIEESKISVKDVPTAAGRFAAAWFKARVTSKASAE